MKSSPARKELPAEHQVVTAWGDRQLSGFGQKELNESTIWVRGSLRTCQIRGLKLVFCIRFRYEGKYNHRKQGQRSSYSLLSQLLSVVIFQSAHSSLQFDIVCRCSKSLPAFRSQVHILTSWGSRAAFCITQVDTFLLENLSLIPRHSEYFFHILYLS